MRDFLDSILDFIVASSLTDEEFSSVTSTIPIYDQSTYDDLYRILTARESVSTLPERLTAFYKAKGVNVTEGKSGFSNIFVGAPI